MAERLAPPGWILVHGFTRGSVRDPEPLLFQMRHICGVYPSGNPPAVTRLLFVNCEHDIVESVEEVWTMLLDPRAWNG